MSASYIPHALVLEGPPAALTRWLADSSRELPDERMRVVPGGNGDGIFFNHVPPPRRVLGTADDFDENAYIAWRRKNFGFGYDATFVAMERPAGGRVVFQFLASPSDGDARPWAAKMVKRYPEIAFTLVCRSGWVTARTEYRGGVRVGGWQSKGEPPHDAPCLLELFELTQWHDDAIRWLDAELARGVTAELLVRRARATRLEHVGDSRTDDAVRPLRAGEADLRAAIKLAPDYGLAYAERALWPGRSARSRVADARTAANLTPDDATAWLGLAGALLNADRKADADVAVERTLALDADIPRAHISDQRLPGRTLDQRIEAVARAVALNPVHPGTLSLMGVLLGNAGRDEEAVVYFQRQRQFTSEWRFYNTRFAELVERLLTLGRWDEAVRECDDVLQCDGLLASEMEARQARRLRAECHRRRGDSTAALAEYKSILKTSPRDLEALDAVVELAMAAGRYAVAKRAADTLGGLFKTTDRATVWASLVEHHISPRGPRQAIKALRYWLKHGPPLSRVHTALAMALCTLPRPTAKDRAEADAFVAPLRKLSPRPDAALAAVHALHGRIAAAMAAQRRAVRAAEDADRPPAEAILDHYRRGNVYATFRP